MNSSHPKVPPCPRQFPVSGFRISGRSGRKNIRRSLATDTVLFRYPHYHRAGDTIDKVDFDRMSPVARGLEKVVAELVGVE